MGMYQRRCPECGKRRPFRKGGADGWTFDGEKMICRACSKKLAAKDERTET